MLRKRESDFFCAGQRAREPHSSSLSAVLLLLSFWPLFNLNEWKMYANAKPCTKGKRWWWRRRKHNTLEVVISCRLLQSIIRTAYHSVNCLLIMQCMFFLLCFFLCHSAWIMCNASTTIDDVKRMKFICSAAAAASLLLLILFLFECNHDSRAILCYVHEATCAFLCTMHYVLGVHFFLLLFSWLN